MKKQILSALTLAIIAINLTACNGNKSESSDNKETNTDTKPAEQTGNSLSSIFPKHTSVFGISIYGTAATPDDSLKHAANIMAEYLDNDEDGLPNNQQVVDHMVAKGASLIIAATENEMESLYDKLPETGAFQDLYVSEIAPNGANQGTFDASLEEVLHLITHEGYAGVYPSTFGEAAGSVIADAMDMARGGQFTTIPNTYPANAWYTYDDATCTYDCMVTEYTYWALTSILGAQDFAGRFEQISHEWKLNTKEKVQSQDLAVYSLLTDPQYGLASTLPDGQYTPMNFEIAHTKVDNTDTTDSSNGSGEQLATFTFENNDSDSETVYMNGVINSNTLSDITALFSQNPQITTLVMQNVPGSMDDEINLLASREIRKRGIATHIPADGMVASGGTDMFLAGSKRTIEPGAQLGVHSWSGGGQEATDFPRDHQEHVKYLDYYQEMAIDTEFYWYTIEAAAADDIHWMTEEEIEQYGILTE